MTSAIAAVTAILPFVNSETQTVPAGGSVTFSAIFQRVTSLAGEFAIPGSLLTPAGVVDPTNVSTNEANLINGNLTDLAYNNSSTGTTNKELPGVDLGSAQDVEQIDVYWWNATYIANDFKLQSSNDGTTWTDIGTYTGVFSAAGEAQEVPIATTNAQYFRLFCVNGNNATYCVLSEMELRGASPGSAKQYLRGNADFVLSEDGSGQLVVTNNGPAAVDVTASYL